jgi:hypothetical protein
MLPPSHARFYAACTLAGLAQLHALLSGHVNAM